MLSQNRNFQTERLEGIIKKTRRILQIGDNKKRELKRLRIKDTSNLYTKDELDSINYFHGISFYKKHQDPSTKPNMFNTRQTFLNKMPDQTAREKYLKSFNCFNF